MTPNEYSSASDGRAAPDDGASTSRPGRDRRLDGVTVFRTTRLADAHTDALVRLYESVGGARRSLGLPPSSPDRIRAWVTRSDLRVHYVALHGKRPVGHATLASGADEGYELAAFVHDAYRGRSLRARLVECVRRYAERTARRPVHARVAATDEASLACYRRAGFDVHEDGGLVVRLGRSAADGDG